jgi:hypothetical protein
MKKLVLVLTILMSITIMAEDNLLDLKGLSYQFSKGYSSDFDIIEHSFKYRAIGFGFSFVENDNNDYSINSMDLYFAPKKTFKNNIYLSGRLGYQVGAESKIRTSSYDDSSGVRQTITNSEYTSLDGFLVGAEIGYDFQNTLFIFAGAKRINVDYKNSTHDTGDGVLDIAKDSGNENIFYVGVGHIF